MRWMRWFRGFNRYLWFTLAVFVIILTVIIAVGDTWLFTFGVLLGGTYAILMHFGLDMARREEERKAKEKEQP